MRKEADEIIDLYRRHARAWANLRGKNLQEKKWLDNFLKLLPDTPSVLDLGCGSGDPIARYLAENGCSITGIDSAPEMIKIAEAQFPKAEWGVSDIRNLQLGRKFQGILAWNSTFHLTPDDQRLIFPVFRQHAANGAALMFTSGPRFGEVMGELEGEVLYHASLDGDEYRALLDQHGFELVDNVVEDPDCGLHTVWLARLRDVG
ncbi:MAG: class I SAM-dependent methyltransferase [Pseudomonadota bacterium]